MNKLKRVLILAALLVVVAGLFLFVISKSGTKAVAPRYAPGQPSDALINLARMTIHGWGDDLPFQGGRSWMWTTANRTNFHTYWVNMNSNTVLGELLNGGAMFCNKDQTKLLCSGQGSGLPALKIRLGTWLYQTFGWKIMSRLNQDESYWILDLRNNRAKPIGSFSQYSGSGSTWHPSPGFRFGYNIPSTGNNGHEFYLCDLELEQMTLVRYDAYIQAWWDEQHLLMKDQQQNLSLYDVVTRQTSPLFSAAQLEQFLKDSNLPESLEKLGVVHRWTREEGSALYLSARTNGVNGSGYLIRVDASNSPPKLELFQRDFQFEWLGHLNAEGTLYLYPGESGKPGAGGDGSVHIRDMQTGEARTLVESDQSNQYTLPRFYKKRVIYTKARQLWSIDVTGSNNFKLFEVPQTLRTTAN